MAGNTITFDSEYMRTYEKNVARAKQLVDEAQACLKRANRHDGWKCAERQTVNSSLGDLSSRLARVSNGLRETSASLTKGAGRFADLENRAQREETAAFNRLNSDYGFTANKWGGGQTNLPVTQVPISEILNKFTDPVFVGRSIIALWGMLQGMLIGGAAGLVEGVVKGGISKIADVAKNGLWSLLPGGKILSRLDDVVVKSSEEVRNLPKGSTLQDLISAIQRGVSKGGVSELYDAVPIPLKDIYVKGAVGGAAGMYEGKDIGANLALKIYENFFGKDSLGLLNSDDFTPESLNDFFRRFASMGDGSALPIYDNYIQDKLF